MHHICIIMHGRFWMKSSVNWRGPVSAQEPRMRTSALPSCPWQLTRVCHSWQKGWFQTLGCKIRCATKPSLGHVEYSPCWFLNAVPVEYGPFEYSPCWIQYMGMLNKSKFFHDQAKKNRQFSSIQWLQQRIHKQKLEKEDFFLLMSNVG